jgi:hypothetical protein
MISTSTSKSQLEIEQLLSRIPSGTLLATLDRETQVAVFEQRYIRQPLVTPSSERAAKFLALVLDRMMYDVYTGKFMYTKSVGPRKCGQMVGCIEHRPEGDRTRIMIGHTFYYASHLVMLLIMGRLPTQKELVDHENGDTIDDTPWNLRLTTYIGNGRNSRMKNNNSTGYSGVDFSKGKFRSRLTVNRKEVHLGYFDTAIEAHKAREAYLTAHPELGFTPRHGK